jgi:hypothetical protein
MSPKTPWTPGMAWSFGMETLPWDKRRHLEKLIWELRKLSEAQKLAWDLNFLTRDLSEFNVDEKIISTRMYCILDEILELGIENKDFYDSGDWNIIQIAIRKKTPKFELMSKLTPKKGYTENNV